MLGAELLSAEIANVATQMDEIRRKLDANEQRLLEGLDNAIKGQANVIHLDPNKVTRRMFDGLEARVSALEAHVSEFGSAMSDLASVTKRLTGYIEQIADEVACPSDRAE